MSEPLDPEKFHVLSPEKQKKLILISTLLLILLLPPLMFFYYKLAINRPAQTDKDSTFEIKSGQGVSQIGASLYTQGLINSEFLFSLYVFINKLDRNIQAGVYNVPAGASLVQVVDFFQHGVNDVTVTFIEGWRVEEFARAASQKFDKVDYLEFVNKAKPYEGYLFPDTYSFSKDLTEDELVTTLRTTFDTKTKDLFTAENLKKADLTKQQIIILASILERETPKEEDRPVVAGILINRLKSDMPLGADATTQYSVALSRLCASKNTTVCAPPLEEVYKFNWWAKDLTIDELNSEDPYNTRKNAGLPPASISNPSISAIKAVINYTPSDYLFYINDSHGNTHFAKTLEEHNANAAQYLNN